MKNIQALYDKYKHLNLTGGQLSDHVIQHESEYRHYNRESLRVQLNRHKSKLKPIVSKPVTAGFDEILKSVSPNSYNPFDLPNPEDDEAKIFKLPVANNNILFLSDIHVPFHSISALTCAIKYGLEQNVNTIYLNGDIIDFYALSRFEKDKRLRNLTNELEQTRQFLGTLRKVFPTAAIYYKLGNHDIRWQRYIREHAREFEGMEEFELSSILRFNEFGVQQIGSHDITHIGKLISLHGHELYGTGGVVPARSLYMKTGSSAIMSHVHRTSEYSTKSIKDEIFTCFSTGCLSTLRPEYNPNSQYNHGFAHIMTSATGEFKVRNFRILNGQIL